MTIARIKEWFNKAVPEPTAKNFNTQLGCHVEEFVEMLQSLEAQSLEASERLKAFTAQMHEFAEGLKTGAIPVAIKDRVEFLDAICDQIVTGTGAAAYQGMDIESALDEVNASNWSKFDPEGNPIFNDDKKIMKGPNYWKPNLTAYV